MVRYWLVVGRPENWHTAFEHGNIWGLKETQRHLWESLGETDMLHFSIKNKNPFSVYERMGSPIDNLRRYISLSSEGLVG